jgi:hypothetical protein
MTRYCRRRMGHVAAFALAVVAGCRATPRPQASTAVGSAQRPEPAVTGSAQPRSGGKPPCAPDLTHCAQLEQQRVIDNSCNETLRINITNTCADRILCNYRTTGSRNTWTTLLAPRQRESNFACDQPPGVVFIARCSSPTVLPEGYESPPGCDLGP